jgi:hypothetical protein
MTIGSQTGKFSIMQAWMETIVQEMTRLTNWPIITLKEDDLADKFVSLLTSDTVYLQYANTYHRPQE